MTPEPNNIYCGNCLELMRGIPDGSIDAVITDPPYGIGFKYDNYDDTKENLSSIIKTLIPECLRISRRSVIFANHRNIWLYPESDWIICYSWNTTGSYCPMGICQWQPLLFYGKDITGFGSINNVLKSDLIQINGGGGVGFMRKEIINHPCPKPLNVMMELTLRLSHPGDIILDPFLGSGTTAVAALRTGRRFIGIEISQEYCATAQRRVDAELAQVKMDFDTPHPTQEVLPL